MILYKIVKRKKDNQRHEKKRRDSKGELVKMRGRGILQSQRPKKTMHGMARKYPEQIEPTLPDDAERTLAELTYLICGDGQLILMVMRTMLFCRITS